MRDGSLTPRFIGRWRQYFLRFETQMGLLIGTCVSILLGSQIRKALTGEIRNGSLLDNLVTHLETRDAVLCFGIAVYWVHRLWWRRRQDQTPVRPPPPKPAAPG